MKPLYATAVSTPEENNNKKRKNNKFENFLSSLNEKMNEPIS
jgi:hypothetical protein